MNTDPWPFVFAAYACGFALIGGYTWWAVREKRRLQKMLDTLLDTIKAEVTGS
ncbi:MAG: hypothetical protein RIQ81_2198 [Pseudomonadota bacterium]|jgi:CcmD family protein